MVSLVAVNKGAATTYAYRPEKGICGAAVAGDLKKVAAFLDVDPSLINDLDRSATPLDWAVLYGQTQVAGFLLKKGADVTGKLTKGITPLHAAASRGRLELVELLLAHGADAKAVTESGYSILYAACNHNTSIEVVRLLLEKGADPGIKSADGVTPLQNAAWREPAELLNILLDGGAEIDQIGYGGDTALHWAIMGDNYEAALLLAKRGADGSIPNLKGTTALKLARKKSETSRYKPGRSWKKVVALLIEQTRSSESANPPARNKILPATSRFQPHRRF